MIDPDKEILTRPNFTSLQMRNMPFLNFMSDNFNNSPASSRAGSASSARSNQSRAQTINPIFGHQFLSMQSCSDKTILFIISYDIYN